MAIPVTKVSIQPMPEPKRLRIATTISVTVHLAIILLVGMLGVQPNTLARAFAPIEVSIEELQPAPVVKIEAPPEPKPVAKPSVMPGGGSRKSTPKRNPSPITSRKPVTNKPASNAGGKMKAAPAPPKLLTSKTSKTPAGSTGKGSAPGGPGGTGEAGGEGPSYGAGVGGGADPIYPKNALDQGMEGTVSLAVSVDSAGKVQAIDITSSSGHALLDNAAKRAVERWSFTPAMQKGKPVAGKVTVTFHFSKGAVKRG